MIRFSILIVICLFCQEAFSQDLPNRRKVVQQPAKDDVPKSTKRTRSKIVNDSARAIYGPKTTLSITEQELFENKKKYQTLDTSIYNLHRWNFVQRFENKYQDLGNVGTALNPIFPQVQSTIGATSGFKVYDLYYETAEPRHYDTRSPFSRINIIWGGRGRSITHIEFTRNVHARWNFGFNYRPVLSANQLPYAGNKIYQVKSQYYDVYTSYKSKDERYRMLLSYRRIRHHVVESGGVKLSSVDSTYKAYFDPNASPFLSSSQSNPAGSFGSTEEIRNAFHFYHQYQLARAAQFHHSFDISKQINTFHITPNPETTSYFKYNTEKADTTFVNDANTFQVIQNEIGLKGNAAFLFYDFYYKLRSYSNNMSGLQGQVPNSKGIENYVGSRITFRFDSVSQLSGQAEYLLDGHYKINGALRTPWLDGELYSVLAKPGFMQQGYFGAYNSWVNNFSNTFSNQLSGRIKAQFGPLFISPGFTYTALRNYIYFVQPKDVPQVLPMQSGGNQQIVSPEARMEIRLFKRFHLRPHVIYTSLINNDDHAISIPTWFTNVQLSYENVLFNGALQIQIGIDAHKKSAYKALGYAPSIQQYYIQDSFTCPSFWNADVFLNGRIKRGRFFVKYINLLQQFTQQGYMLTPLYPGVRNTVDFGFELILFD